MNDILQYKGYCADIYFSAEDGIYYGRLVNVNDFVQFEAGCVKDLKRVFIESVESYERACKERYSNTPEATTTGMNRFNHPPARYQQLF